ncbi:hypothetical protein [Roseobacter fucihabitans]|uniref:hypothetical protein n=1 Tax=Roseobacter fucihabitans TaxID=1537242 RepID=UPI001652F14E|nr:hypothetical protein [Roseobacter litoralis]
MFFHDPCGIYGRRFYGIGLLRHGFGMTVARYLKERFAGAARLISVYGRKENSGTSQEGPCAKDARAEKSALGSSRIGGLRILWHDAR